MLFDLIFLTLFVSGWLICGYIPWVTLSIATRGDAGLVNLPLSLFVALVAGLAVPTLARQDGLGSDRQLSRGFRCRLHRACLAAIGCGSMGRSLCKAIGAITLKKLALSTMFAQQERFADGAVFARFARKAGYDGLEISHSTDAAKLRQIQQANELPIVSVHQPAPLARHSDGRMKSGPQPGLDNGTRTNRST